MGAKLMNTRLPADTAAVPSTDLKTRWDCVRERLRNELGEAAFNSWLRPVDFIESTDRSVRLSVPTRFMRDWVVKHYADRIRNLWSSEDSACDSVEILVAAAAATVRVRSGKDAAPHNGSALGSGGEIESRFAFPATEAASKLTFDHFVVGKPNELAYAAAVRVAEAETVPFNPLYLAGGAGLGKTHLMHAIAYHMQKKFPERRIAYLSAERFMYEFVRALRDKNVMPFKEQLRSVDVLMVDDVQFIAGKESTQEEFFHTFNALIDQNRQIVISGDRSPSDLDHMEERMRSRLGWGLVADIHATDYELRLGILQSKGEQLSAKVPQQVLEFLAHRITSNVRELEGGLNRVLAYSNLVGRPITLETTQDVLKDLLRANDRRVSIEDIQKRVAEHFNLRLGDMHSPRRARAVARPRQVAMYLCKQLTTRSLPEIGRKFGGRDHTTVMHAVRKIDELKREDSALAEDIELLKRSLEN